MKNLSPLYCNSNSQILTNLDNSKQHFSWFLHTKGGHTCRRWKFSFNCWKSKYLKKNKTKQLSQESKNWDFLCTASKPQSEAHILYFIQARLLKQKLTSDTISIWDSDNRIWLGTGPVPSGSGIYMFVSTEVKILSAARGLNRDNRNSFNRNDCETPLTTSFF